MSDLGNRMKRYEAATQTVLPPRTYSVLRVDGRAFHTWTRGRCDRPFDKSLAYLMDQTAVALCQDISGARIAYVQSDEISVVFDDLGGVHSEAWFGGEIQKLVSIAASRATATFNMLLHNMPPESSLSRPSSPAMFDARVFTMADPIEVGNYLLWRIQDATRNSITMAAQSVFSHKQLQGISGNQKQEMLFQEHGINWNDYPGRFKRGALVVPITGEAEVTFFDKRINEEVTTIATRRIWELCTPERDLTAREVAVWLTGDRVNASFPLFVEEV